MDEHCQCFVCVKQITTTTTTRILQINQQKYVLEIVNANVCFSCHLSQFTLSHTDCVIGIADKTGKPLKNLR